MDEASSGVEWKDRLPYYEQQRNMLAASTEFSHIKTQVSNERSKKAYEAVEWESRHAVAQHEAVSSQERLAFLEKKSRLMEHELARVYEEKRHLEEKDAISKFLLQERRKRWKEKHDDDNDFNMMIKYEFGVDGGEDAALALCSREYEYAYPITADITSTEDALIKISRMPAPITILDDAIKALHTLVLGQWRKFLALMKEFDSMQDRMGATAKEGTISGSDLWRALLQMEVHINKGTLSDVVRGIEDRLTKDVDYLCLQDYIIQEAVDAGLAY